MTKTQLSISRTKHGQPVGFKNSAGLVRSVGHLNRLPTEVQKRVKEQKRK